VNGGGFRLLRRAGVQVEVGLLGEEAHRLNRGFVKHARTGLPFVTLKGAMTLDGRIATRTGESRWITSALVRRHARLLRREHEALLVGIGTALADDPRLDRRPREGGRGSAALLRVVLDSDLRLSPRSRLVRGATEGPILVFCGKRALPSRRRALEAAGVMVESVSRHRAGLDLEVVLAHLGARGVTSLLVEGGSEVHGSFLDLRLADRLVLYVAPRIVGGRNARSLVGGDGVPSIAAALALRELSCSRVGEALLIEGSLG
jgi:diaminohydroxyphosphoribosylaminopyrimidine deaminase/5-amino-6-(5-phosphoribosylamino)uracil reductase